MKSFRTVFVAVGGDGGSGLLIFIECIDFSPYHFQCLVFRADASALHADTEVEAGLTRVIV